MYTKSGSPVSVCSWISRAILHHDHSKRVRKCQFRDKLMTCHHIEGTSMSLRKGKQALEEQAMKMVRVSLERVDLSKSFVADKSASIIMHAWVEVAY